MYSGVEYVVCCYSECIYRTSLPGAVYTLRVTTHYVFINQSNQSIVSIGNHALASTIRD